MIKNKDNIIKSLNQEKAVERKNKDQNKNFKIIF